LVRTDILYDRKCLHIKLKKDVHLKLREKLFVHELSIQALFDGFAQLVVDNDKRAMKILEDVVVQRVKEQLEKTTQRIAPTRERINELDHNTLYNMINAEETKKRRKSNNEPT